MVQQDIRAYKARGLDAEKTIQGCFEIATNYRLQLSGEAATYEFDTVADEVLFFKMIKPLYNAEIEFHTYCYHV